MYPGKGIRKWAIHAIPNQEVVIDPPFLYLAFFGSRGNADFLHPLFMTPTAAITIGSNPLDT